MALRIVVPPGAEPLTTSEAKAHLRVTASTDDVYIDALVVAARQMAEQKLGRALISQTWDLVLDGWPDEVRIFGVLERSTVIIPMGGVTSVTSVKWHNGTALQTLSASAYQVALAGGYCRIVPAEGYSWPILADRLEAVEIRFVAGYADAGSVPKAIKQWMLLQIGHLYEHREIATDLPTHALPHVDGLLDPYVVPMVA